MLSFLRIRSQFGPQSGSDLQKPVPDFFLSRLTGTLKGYIMMQQRKTASFYLLLYFITLRKYGVHGIRIRKNLLIRVDQDSHCGCFCQRKDSAQFLTR